MTDLEHALRELFAEDARDLAPDAATRVLLGNRPGRRRRPVIAAAAAVAVLAAGTASIAGLDVLDGSDRTAPAVTGEDVPLRHLTEAGERRIAEEMVRRLEAAYPGRSVSWARVAPDSGPRQATPADPLASLRFTVEGEDGYLRLTSLWTRSAAGLEDTCYSWSECLDRRGYVTGSSSYGSPVPGDPTWDVVIVGPRGSTVTAEGTLSVLQDQRSAESLVAADGLVVRAADLDGTYPVYDAQPEPDPAQRAELLRVRESARGWSADLGLGASSPLLFGKFAETPQPFDYGFLDFPGPGGGGSVLSVGLELTPSERELVDCETSEAQRCTEVPAEDGVVVLEEQGRSVTATYVRGDGVAVPWSFERAPEGWTPAELAAYVGEVGAVVERR